MKQLFVPELLLVEGAFQAGWGMLVDKEGRIRGVGPELQMEQAAGPGRTEKVLRPGTAMVPGFVNSHSHAFQVLLRGTSEDARDFRDWVDGRLYPLVRRIGREEIYRSARLAFVEMLQAGTTTVGEFYYLHNGPGGERLGNELDLEVVRAAREVGLRVALLRCLYDQGAKPGQERFKEPPAEAIARTRELALRVAGDPGVSVAPAPHSLHGASGELVQAGAALAAEWGVPWHIHLAEQRGDLDLARERYGTTPLRALDKLGALDSRTVIVHGCWLDPEECALLGERGGGLAYNPLTNMALGDGVTPLPALVRAGVPISLGTDANHKLSIQEELRAAEYLQLVQGLAMGVLEPLLGRGAAGPFEMATAQGGRNLGLAVGRLEPGAWADFLALDLGHPSLQPAAGMGGDALLRAIAFSMVPQAAIREVWVGGERVAEGGRPLRVDLAELGRGWDGR